MTETMIERIYLGYINGDSYRGVPRAAYSGALMEAAMKTLERFPKDSDIYRLMDSAVSLGDAAGEAQGFMLGFKYAARLLRECDG